jgi:hypothetical protein
MTTQAEKVLDATVVKTEIHVSTIPFSWVLLSPPCSANIRETNTGVSRDVEETSEFDSQIICEFRPHAGNPFSRLGSASDHVQVAAFSKARCRESYYSRH